MDSAALDLIDWDIPELEDAEDEVVGYAADAVEDCWADRPVGGQGMSAQGMRDAWAGTTGMHVRVWVEMVSEKD
eukprot:gene4501-4754_t